MHTDSLNTHSESLSPAPLEKPSNSELRWTLAAYPTIHFVLISLLDPHFYPSIFFSNSA